MDTPMKPRHYSARGQSLQERLLANSVAVDSGCREWLRSLNAAGYGTFKWKGDCVLAHRHSYQAFVGEIPDGLHVLHHCDNRKCINPPHLFLGTNEDNVADRVSKGRSGALRGENHRSAKLTEADVLKIISSTEGDRALAKRFNVRQGNIWNIRKGGSWGHLRSQEPR